MWGLLCRGGGPPGARLRSCDTSRPPPLPLPTRGRGKRPLSQSSPPGIAVQRTASLRSAYDPVVHAPVVHADVRRNKMIRQITANQNSAWIAGSSSAKTALRALCPAMTKYEIVLATRLRVRVSLHHHARKRFAPGKRMIPKSSVRFPDKIMLRKREAKRRKAHANHVPRVADKCTQSAQLICCAAARPSLLPPLRGRVKERAAPAFRRHAAALARALTS
jgi:hypothetical protein